MIEVFSVEYLQHGMWVYGPAIIGRPALVNNLSQIAMLPGVQSINVEQANEENAEEFGFHAEDFNGNDFVRDC